MSQNILLTIAYDGTSYHGWQRQNGQITVQEQLEKGLSALFKTPVEIRGASRTDAGVHALGQRALLNIATTIPMESLPLAINNELPRDIRVVQAQVVEDGFHPQYNAKGKTYSYKIYNNAIMNPMMRNYAWLVKPYLNVEDMHTAAHSLVGYHNFLSFCAAGGSAKTFEREIYSIDVRRDSGCVVEIVVTGSGFLYNMVRIIAGTLAYVGYGKIGVGEVEGILKARDRTLAGITAEAQGLTLVEVFY